MLLRKVCFAVGTKYMNILEENNFSHLNIDFSHASHVEKLPKHHQDPFDRMLIAQAIANKLTIITHDKRFSEYDVSLLMA